MRFSFFTVLAIFEIGFSVFVPKNFGFSVLAFVRFADFSCLTFGFRFSRKILTGFLI